MRPLYYILLTLPGIWPKPKEGTAGTALLRAGFPGSQSQWAGLTCAIRSVVTAWGKGWLQKGPVLLTKSAFGLTVSLVSWFPGEWSDQGGCVTSALGTTLLLFSSEDTAPSGVHVLPFTPIHAEQAHSAQRRSHKTTWIKLSSHRDTGPREAHQQRCLDRSTKTLMLPQPQMQAS